MHFQEKFVGGQDFKPRDFRLGRAERQIAQPSAERNAVNLAVLLVDDSGEPQGGVLFGAVVPFERRELFRLVDGERPRARMPRKQHRRRRCRRVRKRDFRARLCEVRPLFDYIIRAYPEREKRPAEPARRNRVEYAVEARGVRAELPKARYDGLRVRYLLGRRNGALGKEGGYSRLRVRILQPEAGGGLHEGVCYQNPYRAQMAADAHHGGRKEVRLFADPVPYREASDGVFG